MKVELINLDLPQEPTSLIANVMDRVSSDINKQIETAFIEALFRKGFSFKNQVQLEDFIKLNCTFQEDINLKQRTYFANNIPFFLHSYAIDFPQPVSVDRFETEYSFIGHFAYL